MKITYYTLGCKVNQYETEKIRQKCESFGFETVPFSSGGDVCIVNTCTVTSVADGKSRAVIRKAKKINPNCFVIVTGCYSQTHRKEAENIDETDLVADIKEKYKIPEIVKEHFKEKNIEKNINNFNENKLRTRTRAVVKVQDGCSQFCAYCLIPFARSHKFSQKKELVIDEVKELCDNNYKEIVLTGIRLGSYNDGENNLADLIEGLLVKTSIERIRLSSIEMWEIDNRLCDLIKNPRMCNHLHIPLQQGTDEILKLMNRPYNTEKYFSLIENIREKAPDIGITTDVIAGFPQETEELFEKSCDFIKKVNFSRIHVFRYSQRPGTVADKLDGQIDACIKKERVEKLTLLGQELTKNFAKEHIGKDCNILFEIKKKDGFAYGYTSNYLECKTNKSVVRNQSITLKGLSVTDNGILVV